MSLNPNKVMSQNLLDEYEDLVYNPTSENIDAFYFAEMLLKDLESTKIKGHSYDIWTKRYIISNDNFPFYVEFFRQLNNTSEENYHFSSLSVFSKEGEKISLFLVAKALLTEKGACHLEGFMFKTREKRKEEAKEEFTKLVNKLQNEKNS